MEPRRQARAFLLGLLSDVDTRSCWQVAEQAGDASPHRIQRLLGEPVWDAEKVRDDVRGYVVDALADPAGVLIIDDIGDLKKGRAQRWREPDLGQIRTLGERAIAILKTWKILTKLRRSPHRATAIVRAIVVLQHAEDDRCSR